MFILQKFPLIVHSQFCCPSCSASFYILGRNGSNRNMGCCCTKATHNANMNQMTRCEAVVSTMTILWCWWIEDCIKGARIYHQHFDRLLQIPIICKRITTPSSWMWLWCKCNSKFFAEDILEIFLNNPVLVFGENKSLKARSPLERDHLGTDTSDILDMDDIESLGRCALFLQDRSQESSICSFKIPLIFSQRNKI